MLYFLILKV